MELVLAYDRKEDIAELFAEYTEMLIEGDAKFQEYLDLQNYDEELAHLEHKYGLPYGRIFVLYADDSSAAGCIGMRRIDEKACELKRLYVRPEFRGQGLGEMLVEKIIEAARTEGYDHILLDTLPFLESALLLYKKLGFYEIESYNNSPMDTSIYMRLDL